MHWSHIGLFLLLFGLKTTSIWPINPKAMNNKTRPSKVYTATKKPMLLC